MNKKEAILIVELYNLVEDYQKLLDTGGPPKEVLEDDFKEIRSEFISLIHDAEDQVYPQHAGN